MRILIAITCLGMGGAQRQVCELAEQFAKQGHQVLIVAMNGESIDWLRSSDVRVVSLNMKKSPLSFVCAYLKARDIILKFKPDVVHSHMVHANIFSRLLRLTTPFSKLICTSHSSNEGGYWRILAYRITARLCDLNTNVSQEAVDISIKRGAASAEHIIAVHNGIDMVQFTFNQISRLRLRSELGLSNETPLLLAVGRLAAAKDYPNLLAAFGLLPKEFSHSHLAIIGIGEEEERLHKQAKESGLSTRVHFLGLRRDVSEWMSAADVFVLSSAWEGFGLVVAEAMACQRVVVATDCGGVKEVIGDCGFLVTPRRSDQLSEAIVAALTLSPSEYAEIGSVARRRIEECYSLTATVSKWLQLYEK